MDAKIEAEGAEEVIRKLIEAWLAFARIEEALEEHVRGSKNPTGENCSCLETIGKFVPEVKNRDTITRHSTMKTNFDTDY